MITKYFQSIKNIKTTIPAIAFQVQEIVFILLVILFQNSWCLRLVGEYEPVIPFQIHDVYSLKDEKWERRVPCRYLSNSWYLQHIHFPEAHRTACRCLSDSRCLQQRLCSRTYSPPCQYLSNSRCLQRISVNLTHGQTCHHPSVATELKDYRSEKIVRTNHRRSLLSYIFAYHIPNGHFTDTPG